ncbi:ankyrin repeat-containing domain, PGG domain protein [Tanacetum coccineum]
MEEAQLELKDNSGNTALCLAAINGNLEVVEIMVAKHKALLSMPDWEGMMPLSNRAWLLQKCVEGDMFDKDGNNMVHLVGKIEKAKRLQDVPGVLQMHVDVLWLEEVESMIPSPVRECKNNFDQTPRELFWKEHKNEAAKCEEWMKGTASHCMVVATLIATIAFTAAFTVPGGYHQTNGIPIFTAKPLFMVFVVSDAISFFSSTTSILMFLSILTSHYAERDLLKSSPKKLMLWKNLMLENGQRNYSMELSSLAHGKAGEVKFNPA